MFLDKSTQEEQHIDKHSGRSILYVLKCKVYFNKISSSIVEKCTMDHKYTYTIVRIFTFHIVAAKTYDGTYFFQP